MLPLSPRICQCMRRFFVKRPTFLAATSNLRVGQNLMHLGRCRLISLRIFPVFEEYNLKAGWKPRDGSNDSTMKTEPSVPCIIKLPYLCLLLSYCFLFFLHLLDVKAIQTFIVCFIPYVFFLFHGMDEFHR